MTSTAHVNLSDVLFFCLAVVGMSHIIVESVFFLPLREWLGKKSEQNNLLKFINKIVNCYQCCGTWCGFLLGLVLLSYNPLVIFASGCVGSFVSYTAAVLLTYLETNSVSSAENGSN